MVLTEVSQAQSDLDSLLLRGGVVGYEFKESEVDQLLEALYSKEEETQNKGLTAIVFHLHRTKEPSEEFKKRLSRSMEQLLRNNPSEYAIGGVAAIACFEQVTADRLRDLAFDKLAKANNEARHVFLSMLPYATWSRDGFAKKSLVKLFEFDDSRGMVIESCISAVELGTCDLRFLLDVFDAFCDTGLVSPKIQKSMFNAIRIWHLQDMVVGNVK
ncbi:hypothetical protein SH501x_005323 [Pirellulaceae bacterium SH501]